MRRLLEVANDLRPAIIGTAGTGATVVLEQINVVIGIVVGLTTFVYLVIRIRKELKK